MKQDETWEGIIEGKDPKKLLELIHAVVHAQTSDQYPCATVCDHESKLCSLQQNVMTNAEHYEKFNTKVDVGLAVGVEHKHPALLKHATKMMHNKSPPLVSSEDCDQCNADEQAKIDAHVGLQQ